MQSPSFWDPASLRDEMVRQFDVCGSCRLCVNFCPSFPALFDAIDNYDGDTQQLKEDETRRVTELCFLCEMCFLRCPYTSPHEWAIDIPDLLRRSKAVSAAQHGIPVRSRLLNDIDRIGPIASMGAPITNWANTNSFTRVLLEKVMGVDRRAILPRFHGETFLKWYESNLIEARDDKLSSNGKVALFYSCLVNYNHPEIGKALIRVLEKNGVEVVCPDQRDCGMPYVDLGDLKKATNNMHRNIESIYPWVVSGYDVVVPEPTCGMMLKKEYPKLIDTEEARIISEHTFDISEFLLNLYKAGRLDTNFLWSPGRIAYHMPCHLRYQQMGNRTAELLRLLPDTSVQFIDRGCSGHDGTWGIKVQNFDYSMKVGRRLFSEITDSDADYVVTDCSLAGLQITQGTGREVFHPVEILSKAYGI